MLCQPVLCTFEKPVSMLAGVWIMWHAVNWKPEPGVPVCSAIDLSMMSSAADEPLGAFM
jgi:hypothetical protein